MRKARTDPTDIETIRRSLVTLRRLLQRKELVELWAAAFGQRSKLDYTELRLLDAVQSAGASHAGGGATVGDISRLLGIDPSRASRLVSKSVKRGMLARKAEQSDARKVLLEVTKAGAKQQAMGSQLTRSRIELATREWSATERRRFSLSFARFVAGMLPGGEGAR